MINQQTQEAIEKLAKQLNEKDLTKQAQAALTLKGIGAPAVDTLIDALHSPDPQVRMRAAGALIGIGDPRSVPHLIELLSDPADNVRLIVTPNIARFGDLQAVDKLKHLALEETNASNRVNAWRALAHLGDKTAVMEALIKALGDKSAHVVTSAVQDLERSDDPRVVDVLLQTLASSEGVVWAKVITTLGKRRDPRALAPIIGHLQGEDSNQRALAAQALGYLGDEQAVEPLAALLKDKEIAWSEDNTTTYTVADIAEQALRRIGTPDAMKALKPRWKLW